MKTKIKKSKDRCKKYRLRLLDLSQGVDALHIGGSFSCCEILDSIYNILKKKNDKVILSKGHTGVMQYIILEDLKIISRKLLNGYGQKYGKIGVHPEYGTPGITASTGSLGHGLGIGAGIALSQKKNELVYVVISDGELMEGSTWEYILFISSYKINNIVLIIDNNDLQSATRATETHPTMYPIKSKLNSFGWQALECKGNDSEDIIKKVLKKKNSKPLALIAKTIKGYPISFMKNIPQWHYRSPNKKEYLKAINEIKSL